MHNNTYPVYNSLNEMFDIQSIFNALTWVRFHASDWLRAFESVAHLGVCVKSCIYRSPTRSLSWNGLRMVASKEAITNTSRFVFKWPLPSLETTPQLAHYSTLHAPLSLLFCLAIFIWCAGPWTPQTKAKPTGRSLIYRGGNCDKFLLSPLCWYFITQTSSMAWR